MLNDLKELIQVEKASNNSFLKTFNLTFRTHMYHCEMVQMCLRKSSNLGRLKVVNLMNPNSFGREMHF